MIKSLKSAILTPKVDNTIKKCIQVLSKLLLIDFFSEKKLIKKIKNNITQNKNQKNIFFISTPCHGNLGDQAIVFAQEKFINNIYPKNKIIDISSKEFLKFNNIIKNYVLKNDLIIINGGGNLGSIWENEDDIISNAIKAYPNNKIVVFPQTCFYSDTKEAKLRLENNKVIYSNAKDLTIFLRDMKSFDFFKENFSNLNYEYAPDIVLYLDDLSFTHTRKDCLLVFRKDVESVVGNSVKEDIKNYLTQNNIHYSITDTVVNKSINQKIRNKELMQKLNQFASSKLIITDRLHGMIFSVITKTPCIALDNSSKKVSGVYEWISHLDYIKVCNSKEEVINSILEFYNKENNVYSKELLNDHFDKIRKVI